MCVLAWHACMDEGQMQSSIPACKNLLYSDITLMAKKPQRACAEKTCTQGRRMPMPGCR